MKIKSLVVFILLLGPSFILSGQKNGIYIPLNFQEAYEAGTRSKDGNPGQKYWQNSADYVLNIKIDPETRMLSGNENVLYSNNSRDTLRALVFHLYPNIFKKGQPRDYQADPDDLHDGINIEKIVVDGLELDISPGTRNMRTPGTLMILRLPEPLYPSEKVTLNIDWNYTINESSHLRTGQVDPTTFFIAYFYPRIAVYDDIDGWNTAEYKGEKEFYHDFGDYDVTVTVPDEYIVWATGILQNPDELLENKYLNRYKEAQQSNEIIHVILPEEAGKDEFVRGRAEKSWHFKASHVPDFAFALSNHYAWDATSTIVDRKTGRTALVQSAYNIESDDFYKVCDIATRSIQYMSDSFPGVPYPYPSMTVFNGLSEMEFPMMVNDMSVEDFPPSFVIELTSHEIFHTYFPFYTGFNETKYAWMDEGLTVLGEYLISSLIDPDTEYELFMASRYKEIMGRDWELPIISNSNSIQSPAYFYNSYTKAGTFFYILRDMLGKDLFNECLSEFIQRWKGKHPMPYDLLFTIEDVSGEDLTWFYKPWLFEFGYADLAIEKVETLDNSAQISIVNKGNLPVPVYLEYTNTDGVPYLVYKDASVWNTNTNQYTLNISYEGNLSKIQLGNHIILDALPSNNLWKSY